MTTAYSLDAMPYPPGSIVWYITNDSIKRGEVVAIAVHITKEETKIEWHVAEPSKGEDVAGKIHHIQRGGLSFSLQNMEQIAQAKSWLFREMHRKEEGLKND